MNQAGSQPQQGIQANLLKSWEESRIARQESENARDALKAIERELADKAASFSQNQLLAFITLKKYARDPLILLCYK
jgi:hypothetical protein